MATSPLTPAEASLPGVGWTRPRRRLAKLEEQRQGTEQERRLARRRKVIERLQGEGLLLVLAIVVIVMWLSSPYFLTRRTCSRRPAS